MIPASARSASDEPTLGSLIWCITRVMPEDVRVMSTPHTVQSPVVPRFPIVREQLASWQMLRPDKHRWLQLWAEERKRLRQSDPSLRRRMWWAILFLVLFFGTVFGSHFAGRVDGVVASMLFLGLSWWNGSRNVRAIDQALRDRLAREGGGSALMRRL
jgi:hypothetical protein